jgi:hypothetical protein
VVIEGRPKGAPYAHTLPEPRHQSVPNEINVLRSGRRLRAVRARNDRTPDRRAFGDAPTANDWPVGETTAGPVSMMHAKAILR